MKQVFSKLTKSALFASILLATVFSFSNCTKEDAGLSVALSYTLSGNASSGQSVPASSGNGSGTFTGTYNASTKVMSYTTTWSNLTGAPLSGGLYTGAAGQVGTSISVWSLGSGLSTSGSFSSSTTLNASQEAELLAGRAYYILTTAANASGEIRGQITASAQ
jgi:hypothetical protein